MAKLTWSIEVTAGTVSKDSPVISEANMDRFKDWLWAWFPQYEADGVTLKTRNVANEAQAFRDWADDQWQETKAAVIHWEDQVAHQAVIDPADLT